MVELKQNVAKFRAKIIKRRIIRLAPKHSKSFKYAILSAFISAILLAGCDDNNYSDCDGREIAFSPIPECVVDYLNSTYPDNNVFCNCVGENTEELFLYIIPSELSPSSISYGQTTKYFTWEKIDCNTMSISGDASGTFEEMSVPEEGILEFAKNLSGEPVENVSCTCEDVFPCAYDM